MRWRRRPDPAEPALARALVQMADVERELGMRVFDATRHRPEFRGRFAYQVDPGLWPPEYHQLRLESADHVARLRSIIATYGWPGTRLVGEDGARGYGNTSAQYLQKDPVFGLRRWAKDHGLGILPAGI